MTLARPVVHDPAGYDEDFYLWALDQAARIRATRPNSLDWENVAEEIESLGRSNRSEIRTRLVLLMQHLLKWAYQPARRGTSWRVTITNQRLGLEAVIKDSPSLRAFPAEVFDAEYERARNEAALEMDVDPNVFPAAPPFSLADVLRSGWLPDDMTTPE